MAITRTPSMRFFRIVDRDNVVVADIAYDSETTEIKRLLTLMAHKYWGQGVRFLSVTGPLTGRTYELMSIGPDDTPVVEGTGAFSEQKEPEEDVVVDKPKPGGPGGGEGTSGEDVLPGVLEDTSPFAGFMRGMKARPDMPFDVYGATPSLAREQALSQTRYEDFARTYGLGSLAAGMMPEEMGQDWETNWGSAVPAAGGGGAVPMSLEEFVTRNRIGKVRQMAGDIIGQLSSESQKYDPEAPDAFSSMLSLPGTENQAADLMGLIQAGLRSRVSPLALSMMGAPSSSRMLAQYRGMHGGAPGPQSFFDFMRQRSGAARAGF